MNIFYLSHNPNICAKMHCDKHVVKMCTEYAQILSTCHRFYDHVKKTKYWCIDPKDSKKNKWKPIWLLRNESIDITNGTIVNKQCYIQSHVNHPACKWVRSSIDNYTYLFDLFKSLLEEFEIRYGKSHKSSNYIQKFICPPRNMIDIGSKSEIPRMFDKWDSEIPHYNNRVDEYRKYYLIAKRNILLYKNSNVPYWIKEM